MNAGFGEYGFTTISGKIWQDQNFDGILNPGETIVPSGTLHITQWFWVTDADLIAAFKDDEHFEVRETENILRRAAAGDTPLQTEAGAWVSAKNAGAEGAASTFTRPAATTDPTTGIYQFEMLPSFVYVQKVTEEAAEGEEPIVSYRILQPNDTDITGANEANAVVLDELFMTGYRLTLDEVNPVYGLTSTHVGVNVGDKTLDSDLATITVGGVGERGDNDALRPGAPGDRTIQVVEEFFDSSFEAEPTNDAYENNAQNAYDM